MGRELKSVLAAACTMVLVLATFASAPARTGEIRTPATAGTCRGLNTTEFATSRTTESTTSESFINLNEGGRIDFESKRPGCVVVTFSGEAFVPDEGALLILRVLLDGATACEPGDNLFARGVSEDDHAMTHACSGVPAGGHSIQVLYRSYVGTFVALERRTLVVLHR